MSGPCGLLIALVMYAAIRSFTGKVIGVAMLFVMIPSTMTLRSGGTVESCCGIANNREL